MAILKIRNENGEMEGIPFIQGDSGVYIGDGEMPDGYNVQIDPSNEETFPAVLSVPQALTEEQKKTVQENIGIADITRGIAASIPFHMNIDGGHAESNYYPFEGDYIDLMDMFVVSNTYGNQAFMVDFAAAAANNSIPTYKVNRICLDGWCNIPFGIDTWDILVDGIPREEWNKMQKNVDGKTKYFEKPTGTEICKSYPNILDALPEKTGYKTAKFSSLTIATFVNTLTPDVIEAHDITLVAYSSAYKCWVPVGIFYDVPCYYTDQYKLLTSFDYDYYGWSTEYPWGTPGKFFHVVGDYWEDGAGAANCSVGEEVTFEVVDGQVSPSYEPFKYFIKFY